MRKKTMSKPHKKVHYRFDLVGICEQLAKAGGSMSKRHLRRARHHYERLFPGRSFLEYNRLLAAVTITGNSCAKMGAGSPSATLRLGAATLPGKAGVTLTTAAGAPSPTSTASRKSNP